MSTLRNAGFSLLAVMALCPLLMPSAIAQQSTSELIAAPQGGGTDAAQTTPSATDDQLHIGFFPYLWFIGMHGTTGVLGYNTSVRASAGDLLSHIDIGLMGTLEARKGHVVVPIDFVWAVVSAPKGLPLNEFGVDSVSFRSGQFIFTPKAGYEIIDTPKFKVDSLVGLRYWHLGEKLSFNPPVFNSVSASQGWVDGVGGGRFEILMSPVVSIIVAGDAGGGGSNCDYQAVGLLGVRITKAVALQGGWRYLDVDYRNNNKLYLYNMTLSGAVFGATIYFK
jgi:hypothetical protein